MPILTASASFLTGWRGYLAAAAVGAAGAAWAAWSIQGLRLDAVRAELGAANDRISFIAAENKQCAADIRETREAMFAIKQAVEERERAAAAAVAAAEADAATAEQRAADLANQKPATADQCAAADTFTRDYMRGRQ